ncbi:MAG: hypothetical protein JWQ00_2733, partial [Noviherbaspirillum sp.]|nr:hypothetical protein [Noviherbaspirillum sp.]
VATRGNAAGEDACMWFLQFCALRRYGVFSKIMCPIAVFDAGTW